MEPQFCCSQDPFLHSSSVVDHWPLAIGHWPSMIRWRMVRYVLRRVHGKTTWFLITSPPSFPQHLSLSLCDLKPQNGLLPCGVKGQHLFVRWHKLQHSEFEIMRKEKTHPFGHDKATAVQPNPTMSWCLPFSPPPDVLPPHTSCAVQASVRPSTKTVADRGVFNLRLLYTPLCLVRVQQRRGLPTKLHFDVNGGGFEHLPLRWRFRALRLQCFSVHSQRFRQGQMDYPPREQHRWLSSFPGPGTAHLVAPTQYTSLIPSSGVTSRSGASRAGNTNLRISPRTDGRTALPLPPSQALDKEGNNLHLSYYCSSSSITKYYGLLFSSPCGPGFVTGKKQWR